MADQELNLNYISLKRPAIFAHRGSSAFAPENTLSAFKLAVIHHADAIELDVKLSSDDQVVVMHDDTVNRTTDGSGRIRNLSLNELKKLDAGSKFDSTFKSETIPTLAEVFEAVGQQIFINIELTNYSSPTDNLPEKVISLIKQFGLENSTLLSSFNFIALIKARYLLPKIPLGYLSSSGLADPILRSRLVRLGPLLAFHPDYTEVKPKMIRDVHKANARIHTFTVNQPDIMKQLFLTGVDGIFTDNPPLALQVLAEIHR